MRQHERTKPLATRNRVVCRPLFDRLSGLPHMASLVPAAEAAPVPDTVPGQTGNVHA
ncbi:hypothetical protein BCCH1_48740 [Burkholderia contaminans]|uniref:Uncharacterized protein n=1 Tax=Burkholderia contaminans TaxID=488447 RepID=A0A250LEX3_9BURK|nr:hypothetical protein BCCH1_48740 [Burkholderia contaminans]GLZ68627.1 hypothetical protein Bcon01_16720 [Burkholderia contaminans]